MLKNIFKLGLALALALTIMLIMLACNSENEEATGGNNATEKPTEAPTEEQAPNGPKTTYTVNVQDFEGNAFDNAGVDVYWKDQKMTTTFLMDGVAQFTLNAGEYNVALSFPDGSKYTYDLSAGAVNETTTEITITVYNTVGASEEVYGYSLIHEDNIAHTAHRIGTGGTLATLKKNERNYFIFTAELAGEYVIDTVGEGLSVGYYGGTHFIQQYNLAEMEGSAIKLSIPAGSVGAPYVIGVDSDDVDSGIVTVKRVSDYKPNVEDLPWTIYEDPDMINFYENGGYWALENYQIFDVKSTSLSVVYNETDKYYHLNSADGPIIFIDLGTASEYLASFKDIYANQAIRVMITNEDGSVTKESYGEMMELYGFGRVPLTKALAYAVQIFGEYNGWWDFDGDFSIFGDDKLFVNRDNAWLFYCGYYESVKEAPVEGLEIDGEIKLKVENGDSFALKAVASGTTLKIVDAKNVKVLYNGQEYTANDDGIITVELGASKEFTVVGVAENTNFITVKVS